MALEEGKGLDSSAVPKLYRGARVLVLPGTRIGPALPQINKEPSHRGTPSHVNMGNTIHFYMYGEAVLL